MLAPLLISLFSQRPASSDRVVPRATRNQGIYLFVRTLAGRMCRVEMPAVNEWGLYCSGIRRIYSQLGPPSPHLFARCQLGTSFHGRLTIPGNYMYGTHRYIQSEFLGCHSVVQITYI